MRKVKQKSNNGFSMVEMMIVITLITIMATIGISNWTRYVDNSNLREAARDIEADIKFMQRNARASAFMPTNLYFDTVDNADYKIIFNQTSNEYTLEARDQVTSALLFTRTKRLSDFGRSNITFDSFPEAGTTFTLTFQKRGTLWPTANSRTFVIRNRRNSSASIVYQVTGKVHVKFSTQ